MIDEEQSLDDALAAIGLDTKPITREDELYLILTEGKHQKLAMCRYWMRAEMARFKYLMDDCKLKLTVDVVLDGKLQAKQITKLNYAKLCLRYYLQMHHLPYFQDLDSKPAANLDKMVELLAAHHDIKEVIEKQY